MNKIRIVIADDIEDIRDYFRIILSREPDMEVVGTASSSEGAVTVVRETKPDIILMDVQMETENAGIHAIRKIKQEYEHVKIIVLTIHEENELLFQAYGLGAMDYIVKTSSLVDVLSSIRDVYNNKLSLRPEIAEKILAEFARLHCERSSMVNTLNIVSKLTNTEFEILKAICKGISYKQIAKQRYVEDVTVRTQVNKILKKFGKGSMKEVIKLVKQLKIFDIYGTDK